jgi:hypothetical protein
MDPLLKTKWLEKLRSDQYTQTRSTLKDTKGYCCLGVLCEVLKENPSFLPQDVTIEEFPDRLEIHLIVEYAHGIGAISETSSLPTTLSKALGLESGPLSAPDLITMNDDKGYPFWRIANEIEEKL